MSETVTYPEAPTSPDLKALVSQWAETPPPSLTAALAEQSVSVEALEEYIRSGIATEDAESLRKVLVQAAAGSQAEDATLLARLTPLLDPRERAWERVMRAKNSGEVLTAPVVEATKGGVVVDLGVRGFVPSSQIGLSVPRNLTQYVGRPLRLRVLEVDRRRQTVVLTNRQVLEEERAEKRKGAIGRLEEGEERTGTVRRITDIGAFVDVGGVDGLLHVSEISWRRVEHPSDILKVGQKVQVKVLRVDPDAGRVSLSMRRLAIDPWEEVRRKYSIGTTVTGKISKIVPQGAVVELESDLEGFLPVSELATRRVNTPDEVVQVGQELEMLVIDLQLRERRIVLSLRKLEQKRERTVIETVQRKQVRNTERTTLGDLFGHLFEEYQPEPEPTPAAAEAASTEDAPSGTPAAEAAAVETGTQVAGTDASEVEPNNLAGEADATTETPDSSPELLDPTPNEAATDEVAGDDVHPDSVVSGEAGDAAEAERNA